MDYVDKLRKGELIVARTDTIYGLLASARNQAAVEKVYTLKGRDFTKPCIVLVAHVADILTLTRQQQKLYEQANALRPTSVIVPATIEPAWITRYTESVAYRVCREPRLRQILQQTGPVIAPSANPQGLPPARTIDEATQYFGHKMIYIDGGEVPLHTPPSRLMQFKDNKLVHVAR